MKILGRHKWVSGATITESVDDEKSTCKKSYRRFTATINGYRNWKIYEGFCFPGMPEKIKDTVAGIKNKIDDGDEEIFKHKGYFLKEVSKTKRR